jgi:hypothetical protein
VDVKINKYEGVRCASKYGSCSGSCECGNDASVCMKGREPTDIYSEYFKKLQSRKIYIRIRSICRESDRCTGSLQGVMFLSFKLFLFWPILLRID